MIMRDSLTEVIEDAMRNLATQFALRVIRRDEGRQYAAVLYANQTTGLKVAVDWTELRPFLTIYELENEKVVQEVPAVSTGTNRSKAFDVDDLLLERPVSNSPVGKMFSGREDRAAADLLGQYSVALSTQAADVLTGHFEIFQRLDATVRTRAQSQGRADT